MAACFDLVPSASQHRFLKTAVTSGLTCGQAYHLQLHIRHLADALIPRRVTIRAAVEKGYSVRNSCDPQQPSKAQEWWTSPQCEERHNRCSARLVKGA